MPIPDSVRRLCAAQDGVISREQAFGLGISREVLRRLLRTGRWMSIERGLYVDLSIGDSWLARAWGGVLLGGAGAHLAGESAAYLHRIVEVQPRRVEVLTPWPRLPTDREWVHFRRERSAARRPPSGAPPRSHIVDTVLDLCARSTPEEAIGRITSAIQRGRLTPEALSKGLRMRVHFPHRRLLADLIADSGAGAHSALELRYLRDVERAHGLPPARRQTNATPGNGWTDVYYDKYLLVVELDGERWHRDRQAQDRRRDNTNSLGGVLTLRYGWPEIAGMPCVTAVWTAKVLRDRGWDGAPNPCSNNCEFGSDTGW